MHKVRKACAAAAVFSIVFLLGACGATDAVTDLLFTANDDIKLGQDVDKQIRSNPSEYPLLNNATANAYLQNMINKIISAPEIQYRGKFPYKVEIIRDDKTINAFCTPGGYIYVYTGLIKMLDNEASIAGVLGHEIAHAERRHSAKRMVNAYGANILLSVVLGSNPDKLAEIGANLLSGLALLKNSRADETESDEYSVKYLRSTNWYPGGVTLFFEKVKGRSSSDVEALFSTHPLPEDRIADVQRLLSTLNIPAATESSLQTAPYTAFKRTLP
jgi:predicted Zn-dependent protease